MRCLLYSSLPIGFGPGIVDLLTLTSVLRRRSSFSHPPLSSHRIFHQFIAPFFAILTAPLPRAGTARPRSRGGRVGSASTVEDLYGRFFSSNGVAAGGSQLSPRGSGANSLPEIQRITSTRRHMRPGREANVVAAEAAEAAAAVAARAEVEKGVYADAEPFVSVALFSNPVQNEQEKVARAASSPVVEATPTPIAPGRRASSAPGAVARRASLVRLAETDDADAGSTPAVHAVDEHHADIDAEFEKLKNENSTLSASNAEKDATIAKQAKELTELRAQLAALMFEAEQAQEVTVAA